MYVLELPLPGPQPTDKPLPVGRPIGNTRMRILDPHQQAVPIGEPFLSGS